MKKQLTILPNLSTDEAEGYVLSDDERQRLRALVERDGVPKAAKALGISKSTIVRALSSLRLQRGSVALVRQGLAGR